MAEAGADDDGGRAVGRGGDPGYGLVDAEPPRLVGRRGQHAPTLRPPTHQPRQAVELGVFQLICGDVEGVQVGVDDVVEMGTWEANRAVMARLRLFYSSRILEPAPNRERR